MRKLLIALTTVAVGLMFSGAPKASAAVNVGINIGPAPVCPYGYYDTSPYLCAAPGYYGPEWFNDGVFIGAGPWFRGDDHFRGHVNNHFRPDHGYKGALPNRGDKANNSKRQSFHGNEMRDGHGHVVKGR